MSSKPTTSPSENYYSGLHSPCDSILIEEQLSGSHDSLKSCRFNIISYESVSADFSSNKEIQTEILSTDLKQPDLSQHLKDLQKKCLKYKKQNKDLRKEIKAVQEERENDQVISLKEEINRLKGKIQVHQMMAEKIAGLIGDLLDDSDCHLTDCQEFRVYSSILNKVDQIRKKIKDSDLKILSLESERISLNELLSFYTSTSKLLKNQIKNSTVGVSITPDCLNAIYTSRKSSSLTENTLNSIRNNLLEGKKPVSSDCEKFKQNGLNRVESLRNTNNSGKMVSKKIKNRTSTSPLIPKPQKGKGGCKRSVLRSTKTIDEECKRRERHKS